MPQREALARCADGAALDGCGDAGSGEGVSTIEGSQATAGAAEGVGCAGGTERHRHGPCAGCDGCVECYWAMAVRQVSTESGTFPDIGYRHTSPPLPGDVLRNRALHVSAVV